ncbi:MAG: uroporphyrinogen-III C-methyltransferase [Prevotella sp.]|nr:uroporphyrinogen-III C-methyltransferase [Prevotella sp.]
MEFGRRLRVVGRDSTLSFLQVKELFSLYPSIEYDLTGLKSFGDKNKHISLMSDDIAGDFFTRELDAALLNNEADIAVHSAKDLPCPIPAGLELYCLTAAVDKTDSLVSKNNLTLLELPSGAKVGTSSGTRKAEILKIRPDLTVISIRGTIEERILQVDRGHIDALVVATCALLRLGLSSRIAAVLPFRTHPLQGNLAVLGKEGNPGLKTLFSTCDIRKSYGKVTLAGFGPGNPDLLTIAGDKALSGADIIFYDDLLDKDFLKKYNAPKVYVGKRKDKHSCHQDDINELVYRAAISGKNVVRLKGGDPMIFAHGREEIDFLRSRFVEVDVIPGISSAIALAACTRIPLTHRGMASSVAFVTGHSDKAIRTPDVDTLVYYMAGANISLIARKLVEAGRKADTPVALVHNVSLPGQKTFFTSLKELQFSVIKYPTPVLVIIGEVVSLENGEAHKQNSLVTGTTCVEYAGAGNIVHTPLIKLRKNEDKGLRKVLAEGISSHQWIVFTSRYGVRFFFEILNEIKFDMRSLGGTKIASIGKTTSAELGKYHIYPDVEPEPESAEGLIKYFKEIKLAKSRILLPRSDKGLKYLSEELTRLGNYVTDAPVYNNIVNKHAKKTDLTQFQKIIFASPSGVDAFKSLYGEIPGGVQLIARGRSTENKIKLELNETF